MSRPPVASVDIANLALARLGQQPITSLLVPDSPTADICELFYDATLREMLRKYIFNFSRKTTSLSPSADAPTHPEFTRGYALPSDFIRLLKLGDRVLYGGAIPTQFYDFSAGYLYCDDITNQGTGVVNAAPTLTITAIYRSGETVSGTPVPAGYTVVAVSGGTPIPGAQYLISAVVGSTQANGNTFQIVAGTLGALDVYYLQTTGGQNFSSAAWGVYVSGGQATPTYVPPGSASASTTLQMNYIFYAQDVPKFDPLFIKVMWLQMAVNMCKQLTKKEPSKELLAELSQADLAAAAVAGQEKPPERVQRSRLRDVRRSGGIFRNNTVLGSFGSP